MSDDDGRKEGDVWRFTVSVPREGASPRGADLPFSDVVPLNRRPGSTKLSLSSTSRPLRRTLRLYTLRECCHSILRTRWMLLEVVLSNLADWGRLDG